MEIGQPSRTAMAAAAHRAVHQVLEQGRIFCDPLALRILGVDADILIREAQEHPSRQRMRFFIASRTRFAEDTLAAAVKGGLRQLVVLGAGLDTYAYRRPPSDELRVFEVDHPATQEWKRSRLADAGIPIPESLTFAPVDFERQTLAEGLAASALDPLQQTFFTWLGVVPYLSEQAVWSTLAFIANLPHRSHVVFDYSDPPASLSPEMRSAHDRRAEAVARFGEPFVTWFEPARLHAELQALGFSTIEDLGPPQIAARYVPDRSTPPPSKGGHILYATTAVHAHCL